MSGVHGDRGGVGQGDGELGRRICPTLYTPSQEEEDGFFQRPGASNISIRDFFRLGLVLFCDEVLSGDSGTDEELPSAREWADEWDYLQDAGIEVECYACEDQQGIEGTQTGTFFF